MKQFSLPARTGRLPPADDEGTDESKMEAPASPTTETLPEGLTTSSATSKFISSDSLCSLSETAPTLSETSEGDPIANSRRVWVATSHGSSVTSRPQPTDTRCRTTGLATDCSSRGTESNNTHRSYIATTITMRNR